MSAVDFVNSFLKQITFDLKSPALDIGLGSPVQPETNLIKIYYPISAFDEYEPIFRLYRQAQPITVRQILDSIYLFYNEPLARQNIRAYTQNPAYPPGIKVIRDVLGGRTVVVSLTHYQDGLLVNLSAPS